MRNRFSKKRLKEIAMTKNRGVMVVITWRMMSVLVMVFQS